MTKIVRIKNASGANGTWRGISIPNNTYYDIPNVKLLDWQTDNQVFTDISNGNLIVNRGADDTGDVVNPLEGWQWLTGEDERKIDPETRKLSVHESSRPLVPGKSFLTVWTGVGDDVSNHILGGGPRLNIETQVGVPTASQDIEFDPQFGSIYIHEGYAQWEAAGWNDCIDVCAVAKPTPLQTSTNLDYELDGTKIKIASGGAGTGTHGLAGNPVFVPNRSNSGYWSLDSNDNPVYSPTQEGKYDWHNVEVVVNRFINKVPVYGSSANYIMLQGADTSFFPPGYVLRIIAFNNSNTAWRAWMFLTIYREQTV